MIESIEIPTPLALEINPTERNVRNFRRKIIESPDGCLVWTASTFDDGYGKFNVGGKNRRAHRVSWVIANGNPPAHLCVLHKCDNRRCVRVEHLFLGTHAENSADMVRKNRSAKGDKIGMRRPEIAIKISGENHYEGKLSDAKVRDIRARRAAGGCTNRSLAKEYGVSPGMIGHIVSRLKWKHVQ